MTDPATLLALADRCEQAAGSDRELDAEIAVALFGGNVIYDLKIKQWRRIKITSAWRMDHPLPPYTTSLDAALTLVPEGCGWMVMSSAAKVGVWPSHGATPALALCAAALRARAAEYE